MLVLRKDSEETFNLGTIIPVEQALAELPAPSSGSSSGAALPIPDKNKENKEETESTTKIENVIKAVNALNMKLLEALAGSAPSAKDKAAIWKGLIDSQIKPGIATCDTLLKKYSNCLETKTLTGIEGPTTPQKIKDQIEIDSKSVRGLIASVQVVASMTAD